MNYYLFIVLFVVFFILEILYFQIADKFNIIDQPNHRSSHSVVTLRGGGVIFAAALILYPMFFQFEYEHFILGLIAIAFISFMDDIRPVSNKLRILIHLGAVSLMFFQLGLFNLPFYWIILALIFVIGSINAINFMDGINGITGSYALITLCSLLYINVFITSFTISSFLITSIISLLVFNFFNFRKKAKCFAGDVGSMSIAFIMLFFILQLILKSENFNYLLLILLYGLDAVSTIFFRLWRKENIFDAHRSHFYQYLANEKKKPHIIVSFMYALIQLFINVVVIFLMPHSVLALLFGLVFCTLIFIAMRFFTEGRIKLLGS